MADWQRTHTCGELRTSDSGQTVTLTGWIENHRDHGHVLFVDLRDRYGVTQIVFDPDVPAANETAQELREKAAKLGAEDVLSVTGVVRIRESVNKDRETGEVELAVTTLRVLNEADPPPFEILDDVEANEELRMRYRYLDLRRRPLARALAGRARFTTAVRNFLAARDFLDLETPILTKSTPEGARDYLVPSRVNPGEFYALPQSPQIFKQLAMVAGLDRYFQIARCFRDEDLRQDRQPEFTQIDMEMSFVEEADVLELVEAMMVQCMKEGFGIDVPTPFERLSHADAMKRFGSDKPDLRFGMELVDIGTIAAASSFKVFSGAIERGGAVQGICVAGQADKYSRKQVDGLTAFVADYGAKGLAWGKVTAEGITGSISKFFAGDDGAELMKTMGAEAGDLLLFVADTLPVVQRSLGELRVKLGNDLGLRNKKEFKAAWVLDFPMFDHDAESDTWFSSHHPFTAPADESSDFSKDPGSVVSRAYDLTMNGWELGSGSIRIHRKDVQERVFKFLGISEEEQQSKFGFLLDAFRFGAPPHGGLALGLDRIVALAEGADSLRDVIAFPKTTSASDLMCDAPSNVASEQLAELHVKSTYVPKPDGSQEETKP